MHPARVVSAVPLGERQGILAAIIGTMEGVHDLLPFMAYELLHPGAPRLERPPLLPRSLLCPLLLRPTVGPAP